MDKRKLGIFIGIIFTLFVIGGGFMLLSRGGTGTPTPTPTLAYEESEEEVVEEEVEEEVDVSEYKVKVLNGTTITGLAATIQAKLQSKGFTVLDIGNATPRGYTTVEIQAKSSVSQEAINTLKEILEGESYTIGTQDTLEDNDENDIVVILGTNIKPTQAVTAAPTLSPTTSATTGTITPTITPTPTTQ